MLVPEQLISFFESKKVFYIAGHTEPDGDCLGSQLALASMLRRLGKEAVLLSAGPFVRPEAKEIEHLFTDNPGTISDTSNAGAVIVDCSTPERTGSVQEYIDGLETAVIDHHASGSHFGQVRYIDPAAPSVTLMVYRLMKSLSLSPDAEESRHLFFGLCTDTGFFRHLEAGSGESFRVAGDLSDQGASPKEAFNRMYGGKPLASRQLLGLLLARACPFFGGKVTATWESYSDTQKYGILNRDSDTLYQLLTGSAGCKAVILIREEKPGECSVGLRSIGPVDVGSMAKAAGGGGHKLAAGYPMKGTPEEVLQKAVAVFAPIFGGTP